MTVLKTIKNLLFPASISIIPFIIIETTDSHHQSIIAIFEFDILKTAQKPEDII
jgi:hypothetical protein